MSASVSGIGKQAVDIAPRALEEAAEWFASLASPSVAEAERTRWQAWLSADPDHARAWQRVEAVARRMALLTDAGTAARVALKAPRSPRRRTVLRTLAVLVAGGGGAMAAMRLPWDAWRYDVALRDAAYRTAIGEVLALTLPDGSRIWLGTRSVLDVAYSSRARGLMLHAGDLVIETARDARQPSRPFTIDTHHGRIRALGTRFAVRSDALSARTDVFEGAVELISTGASAPVRVFRTGEHAVFDGKGIVATGAASAARDAWTRGMLLADGLRLDALIAELARWHATPLSCAPDVAALRVVGVYPLRDLAVVLAALQASLPVEIRRIGQGVHILAVSHRPGAPFTGAFAPPRRLQ